MSEEETRETPPSPPAPPSKFGKGYIQNPSNVKHPPVRALVGAAHSWGISPEKSWEQYLDQVWDQTSMNACVGYTFARLAHMVCAIKGRPIPRPSPLCVYTGARALRRGTPKVPLQDEGCMPYLAVESMQQWGIAKETDWPSDPQEVNAEPTLLELERSVFQPTGVYTVDSEGQSRLDDIDHALDQGYPLGFGTDVDEAFEANRGELIQGMDENKILGRHMMAIVGYSRPNDTYRVVNSWGQLWGDHGMGTFSRSFFLNSYVTDITALTGVAVIR
jgi:hypothetical protein